MKFIDKTLILAPSLINAVGIKYSGQVSLYFLPVAYISFYSIVIFLLFSRTLTLSRQMIIIISPVLLMVLYGITSSLWAIDIGSLITYTGMWLINILTLIVFKNYFDYVIKTYGLNDLLKMLGIQILVLSIIALIRFSFFEKYAIAWPYANKNGYIFFIIPLTFIYLSSFNKNANFISLAIKFFIPISAIILTYSRTAMLGVLIGILTMIIFNFKRVKLKKALSYSLMIIMVVGIITISNPQLLLNRVETISSSLEKFTHEEEFEKGGVDYRRYTLVEEAKAIIIDTFPLGTGIGIDNYLYYFSASTKPGKPHNFYLGHLAEFGIVGLSLILIFFSLILLNILKSIAKSNNFRFIKVGVFSANISLFAMLTFNEYITAPYVWMFWALCMSIASIENTTNKMGGYSSVAV